MRQDSAPQLFDGTRVHAVYTCQQSQFLADWQHQQVNRTAHPLFRVALGSCGKRQSERGERRPEVRGVGSIGTRNTGQGEARGTYTHAHTTN